MDGRHPEALTYTARQAADVLGVSVRTVRRMIASGSLPVLTGIGRRTLIPRAALRYWIANQTMMGGTSHVPHE